MPENIDSLRTFGTKYAKESLFRPVEVKKEIRYGKNHLQIARRLDGSIYALNLTDAVRMLIIGINGVGKSFFGRAISDRLNKIGRAVIHVGDCKNEMWSSNKPVQREFQNGLLEGEEPEGFPIVTLRPTFFKEINKELPNYNFWYSINIRDMSRADFQTMMNASELSIPQKTAIDLIYTELQKRLKKNPELQFSVELVHDIIEGLPDLSSTQVSSLKFKFEPLRQSKFFEARYETSIKELMKEKLIVALNLEGFDRFGKGGSLLYPEVVLNVVINEVITARIEGHLPELFIFFDESARFIGNRVNTSVKQTVLESYDLHRAKGISWASFFQNPSDIPEGIMNQSQLVIIPSLIDVNSLRDLLMYSGASTNQQIAKNEALRLKRKMMKVKHSWLIINRANPKPEIIVPLPPLSHHLKTKK